MGICDLIPGVSGGTVAYVSGIYSDFLAAIQSLNLSDWKKIHWKFLMRIGFGIAISILLFSRLFHFLLTNYPLTLFAFFFGAILATATPSLRKPNGMIALGFVFSFLLSGLPKVESLEIPLWWVFICGMIGSAAMLLPGISGSFMLHILGVYALFIRALSHLDIKFLLVIGLGISSGFIIFSRLVSKLLDHHPEKSHAFLMGCMLGGLRTLWPYTTHNILSATLFLALGFIITFFLERKASVLVK